ncbi:Fic family protein [Patescibacteria group bacterium]|uniref:Fic family protein n=1 Tax=candidate division WWE3 bacterium TaxID=2053526 RepID=A0A928Y4U1_UNCKA|nr:Fic family protein [candidate division WWE3 bacterium]MCL4732821.1 Fic family protein [Patescibacteria group bacterium]
MRLEVTPEAPQKETSGKKEKRVEIREPEAEERRVLLGLLENEALSPHAAMEIVAVYGEELSSEEQRELHAVLGAYGLQERDLAEIERKKATAVYAAATKESAAKQELEITLARQLTERAFRKIDELRAALETAGTPEKTKAILRDLLSTMSGMAKLISIESNEDMALWDAFYERFRSIGESKNVRPDELKQIYQDVFAEFEDVIEVDIYRRRKQVSGMRGEFLSEDELLSELYGRTPEELEELKQRNRKQAAAFILKNKDRKPSIELLEELHRVNNKGIVAKAVSAIRHTRDEQVIYGGGRVGTFGEDVPEEMEYVMARAEWLVANNPNKLRYEVSVAKLHNDLLNIHPFMDRNGSTAMLFAEFLMAKKGYIPEAKRDPSFYNYVRKTFGNNPVAIAVFGGGMYEIGEMTGYYKGVTAKDKERAYDAYMQDMYKRLGAE